MFIDIYSLCVLLTEFSVSADNSFEVTENVKRIFDEYGFILVRGLLSADEVAKLKRTLEDDDAYEENAFYRDDGMGRKAKVCLWNHPRKDVTGMIARSEKVATTFEKLLGGEVYHYHSWIIKKEALEGGSHLWHQDYGYWYYNGCLSPDMGTICIAVDRATKENGCLRIIPKSHHLGRVDHVRIGGQGEADLSRVEKILEVMGKEIAVEMSPGDALFFHCNILHTSAQNSSPQRRWAFLVAYNRADNDPVLKHHHPGYTPLVKVPNSEIMECQFERAEHSEKTEFFKGVPEDGSLRALKQSA